MVNKNLISREAAIAEVMQMVEQHRHEIFRGELLHYTGIKAMIEALPAVDAAPVVHGCWEDKCWTTDYDYGVTNHVSIICSTCKNEIYKGRKSPFCPNCGARMDGERRNDNG